MATSDSRSSGASSGSGKPSPAAEQVLAHLETVLASPVFSSSRRCQKLLRYVVENAVFGRAALLKERTIGIEVFDRPPAYEPSEDAIVRVNANEVRKRLAQYYLKAGREGVWIDLPSGTYVPEFHFGPPAAATPAPPPAAPPPETPPSRTSWLARHRRLGYSLAALLVAAAVWLAYFLRPRDPFQQFWAPVLNSARLPLISVPIGPYVRLSQRLMGELERRNPPFTGQVLLQPNDILIYPDHSATLHTLVATLELSGFFQRKNRPPEFRFGTQITTEELSSRPVVLLGAYNNPWTLEIGRDIRFAFERQDEPNQPIFAIQDRKDPARRWRVYERRGFNIEPPETDYALVTRLFDPSTRQVMVSAAGITQYGTRAAVEFITKPAYWHDLARRLPRGWQQRNLQVVLQTNVVLQMPKPPRVLAWECW